MKIVEEPTNSSLQGRLHRFLVELLVSFSLMPELLKETVEELRQIILEEYKISLSFKDATKIAHDLVGYFSLLARINHNQKAKEYD
mgnify:CR=1 FL=1